jgi:hypothetical protein
VNSFKWWAPLPFFAACLHHLHPKGANNGRGEANSVFGTLMHPLLWCNAEFVPTYETEPRQIVVVYGLSIK